MKQVRYFEIALGLLVIGMAEISAISHFFEKLKNPKSSWCQPKKSYHFSNKEFNKMENDYDDKNIHEKNVQLLEQLNVF